MPLILGALALLGTGGLVYRDVTSDTQQTVNAVTPNLLALGGLAVAGVAVYVLFVKKG